MIRKRNKGRIVLMQDHLKIASRCKKMSNAALSKDNTEAYEALKEKSNEHLRQAKISGNQFLLIV